MTAYHVFLILHFTVTEFTVTNAVYMQHAIMAQACARATVVGCSAGCGRCPTTCRCYGCQCQYCLSVKYFYHWSLPPAIHPIAIRLDSASRTARARTRRRHADAVQCDDKYVTPQIFERSARVPARVRSHARNCTSRLMATICYNRFNDII